MLEISKTHRIAFYEKCAIIVRIGSRADTNGCTYPITVDALKEIGGYGFVKGDHAVPVEYNGEVIAVSQKELVEHNLNVCLYRLYHQSEGTQDVN